MKSAGTLYDLISRLTELRKVVGLNHISALEIQKKKREEGMGLIRLQNTVQVRFSNEISQGECQKRCETGED